MSASLSSESRYLGGPVPHIAVTRTLTVSELGTAGTIQGSVPSSCVRVAMAVHPSPPSTE